MNRVPSLPGPWTMPNGTTPKIPQSQLPWCTKLRQPAGSNITASAGQCVQAVPNCRMSVSTTTGAGTKTAPASAPGLNNNLCSNLLGFVCQMDAGCTAGCGRSVRQGVPLNIRSLNGITVHADSTSKLAYAMEGNGASAPEQFILYKARSGSRPGSSLDSSYVPGNIMSTNAAYMKSMQTGMFCRLSPFISKLVNTTAPISCYTQGLLCDQNSTATATLLVYSGSGLTYQATSLVALPGSGTLVLSQSLDCIAPGGAVFLFPEAPPIREWRLCQRTVQQSSPYGIQTPHLSAHGAAAASLLPHACACMMYLLRRRSPRALDGCHSKCTHHTHHHLLRWHCCCS